MTFVILIIKSQLFNDDNNCVERLKHISIVSINFVNEIYHIKILKRWFFSLVGFGKGTLKLFVLSSILQGDLETWDFSIKKRCDENSIRLSMYKNIVWKMKAILLIELQSGQHKIKSSFLCIRNEGRNIIYLFKELMAELNIHIWNVITIYVFYD